MSTRILVADSRPDVRAALLLVLEQQPDLVVAGEAADSDALLCALGATHPDLVLVDWALSGLPPALLLRLIRCEQPGAAVVVASGRREDRRPALAAGADAFVDKCEPPEGMLACIRAVVTPAP